jgi:hypothetical protein
MKKIFFSFLLALYSALLFAQEKVEVGVDDGKVSITKTNAWYQSPWVWVVGAAVFILLLVALTRGGRRD